jgi:hypothetical protein
MAPAVSVALVPRSRFELPVCCHLKSIANAKTPHYQHTMKRRGKRRQKTIVRKSDARHHATHATDLTLLIRQNSSPSVRSRIKSSNLPAQRYWGDNRSNHLIIRMKLVLSRCYYVTVWNALIFIFKSSWAFASAKIANWISESLGLAVCADGSRRRGPVVLRKSRRSPGADLAGSF